ncbi:MAG: hypothetical protein IKB16_16305 [Lentisphaeria bacterium]|nr:hypothetical protein [Lentisphaeria bacterium]
MGKHIVLGVTGGIACYKSADLCSKLVSAGYEVSVVMTANALKLISAQIFMTLSRHDVLTDVFDTKNWKPGHVDLAAWADLLVVAPATANFIGKYTHGIADDALTTVALACRKPVLLAPAMNTMMWESPALQANLQVLKERGTYITGPADGRLACGPGGVGRMVEVPEILAAVKAILPES